MPTTRPFPQSLAFPGCCKPGSDIPLEQAVAKFYDYFRETYIRESNGHTPGGGFYIDRPDNFQGGNYKTISEAHGYGMIILVLMAGYEERAQEYFDGFYNFYDHHRSRTNPHLMSWVVPEDEGGLANDSATDGDMDIAYALLLAHTQWGSDGKVPYLAQARRIITEGIRVSNLAVDGRTLLGDWDKDAHNSRPSDWMPGHFQAFYDATGDAVWLKAKRRCLELMQGVVKTHAPDTGLVPDFIIGDPPQPARANFLERSTDGAFSWNACRIPLRLAADFAHYGTPESQAILLGMTRWLRGITQGNPMAIHHGYHLNGDKVEFEVKSLERARMTFMAPMLAGSMVDGEAQEFLTRGWSLLGRPAYYYADCLDMLSLLLISGNWWAPRME